MKKFFNINLRSLINAFLETLDGKEVHNKPRTFGPRSAYEFSSREHSLFEHSAQPNVSMATYTRPYPLVLHTAKPSQHSAVGLAIAHRVH